MKAGRTTFLISLTAAVVGALLLAGCLSNRYKPAPKETPPAPQLQLEGVTPDLSVVLHSVVVFKGPGSWKKEAYWDEYQVTLTNRTDRPLTIDSASLADSADVSESPGDDPWKIERRSREKLQQYERIGRKILLGAGWGAAWFGTGVVTAATAMAGGPVVAVVAGSAVFIGLPIVGVGTLVRTISARSDIRREFQKRRLPLPLTLAPHESKSGSLFFAVTPGPKRLSFTFPGTAEAKAAFSLPLDALAGLHLAPEGTAPVKSEK